MLVLSRLILCGLDARRQQNHRMYVSMRNGRHSLDRARAEQDMVHRECDAQAEAAEQTGRDGVSVFLLHVPKRWVMFCVTMEIQSYVLAFP